MPVGLLTKDVIDDIPLKAIPFHNASPCPKRTLKSPRIILIGVLFGLHMIYEEYRSGNGEEEESGLVAAREAEKTFPTEILAFIPYVQSVCGGESPDTVLRAVLTTASELKESVESPGAPGRFLLERLMNGARRKAASGPKPSTAANSATVRTSPCRNL